MNAWPTQGNDNSYESEFPVGYIGPTIIGKSSLPSFPTQIITQRRLVPNVQPIEDAPYKIAIIGEAPGEEEEQYGIPFIGPSGKLLGALLREVGINRNACLIANVCQVRPPANEISRFLWTGPEIQSGLTQLKHDLDLFQPNICVLLGGTALHAAKTTVPRPQNPKHWPYKISDWTGSLFNSPVSTFSNSKCIAGFHPAGILRFWGTDGNFPRLKSALVRAKQESTSPSLTLPHRELLTTLDAFSLCHIMDEWPSGQACSVDIEGGLPNEAVNDGVRADSKKRRYIGWRCVALSARPTKAFAIAWWKFNSGEHARLLQSFSRLMARTDVPKVLQNSLYDNFVMSYGYGIPIRGISEDTMLKSVSVYAELPKSLSVQASIFTREPHWKDEEMYESTGEALAIGCCKDVAVTLEIAQAQDNYLSAPRQVHYRKNIEMLNPALYMELRGIKYDQLAVANKIVDVMSRGWDDDKGHHRPLTEVAEEINRLCNGEMRGKKGSLSSQRLAKALYTQLNYEPQYKKENGRKTTSFTTDVEAILNLQRKLQGDKLLSAILQHRHLEGLLETLSIVPDRDQRVRCSYNIVGTETLRFSCKTSPTGSGANLTTITKSLRGNYIADPDYDFFQCDLSGADGWTVAAHCARLGDETMLLDYLASLKPAKIISGLYAFGSEFNKLNRDDLSFWGSKAAFNAISTSVGHGVYDSSKVVQHGSNYGMGIPTMQKGIMIKTFKETGTPTYLDHSVANALQGYYFSRYPGIRLWHNWAANTLVATGTLTSANGHVREFFGRRHGKDIHDTVKEFLAHEPQCNTTWATNLAMLNLWNDLDNRIAYVDHRRFTITTVSGMVHYWAGSLQALARMVPGGLIIEPFHQVHDALAGQYPTFLREWAIKKIKSYFNNPLIIARTTITIPFEMGIGPSWGNLKIV